MKLTPSHFGITIAFLILSVGCTETSAEKFCEYNPAENQENPLEPSAKLTLRESNGNAIFTYQPTPGKNLDENITLATNTELIFANTDLDTARLKLIQNEDYYHQLIGKETEQSFAEVNPGFTCR
ncbi:hypothetical protein [Phormidium sp. CCY1219]|uniref:hypothetical protein n=1 Tax=Phormidium sp. CCY1219 TaxID=2886104 RepID=UPI002D1EACED|nr:hypothetical protein [Phormidium sp. CCY1219]MEB3828519.1 hypothetical protein [Phormidium sp. CCY1219]